MKPLLQCIEFMIIGDTNSDFVWYEHPDTENPLESQWVPHVIHSNLSDTFLVNANLSAEGRMYEVVLTVGYFSNKLLIHWSNATDGSWINPENVSSMLSRYLNMKSYI